MVADKEVWVGVTLKDYASNGLCWLSMRTTVGAVFVGISHGLLVDKGVPYLGGHGLPHSMIALSQGQTFQVLFMTQPEEEQYHCLHILFVKSESLWPDNIQGKGN